MDTEAYREEGHVKIEAEVGVIVTSQGMPRATRSWKKQRKILA